MLVSSTTSNALNDHGRMNGRSYNPLVTKKSFTTSTEVKHTVEETRCITLSTRHLHEGFTRRCKPLDTSKNRKTRLLRLQIQETSKKKRSVLASDCVDEIKLYQNYEEKTMERERNSWSKMYHIMCQIWWRQYHDMDVYGCQWNGLCSGVFFTMWLLTEVAKWFLRCNNTVIFAHIQLNATKLRGQRFNVHMANGPKHTVWKLRTLL